MNDKQKMAARAAAEIKHGMVVNLGIGIPSLTADYVKEGTKVMFHAENGITGMGPAPSKGDEDANLCNAGGMPVTYVPGASYCDSSVAFAMIRRGRIDLTILGALQVSAKGDLANWIIPGKKVPGMGGAMELAAKAGKVIVLMSHTDRAGNPKLVKECSLPLTSSRCADLVITELAVFKMVEGKGLVLAEYAPGISIAEIEGKTGYPFEVDENIKEMTF